MYNPSDSIFLKILIVGDPMVGKTSILNQFCYKRFDENTRPTIGCDFSTTLHKKDDQIIKAQFWDIAGQEKFHSVSKMYVRGAQGCLIVCDITNEFSLQSTLKWKELIEIDKKDDGIPIILVQNKKDLIPQKEEELKEHMKKDFLENFSKENKFLSCLQTSAKTAEGLENVFDILIDEILKRRIQTSNREEGTKLYNLKKREKKEGGCC